MSGSQSNKNSLVGHRHGVAAKKVFSLTRPTYTTLQHYHTFIVHTVPHYHTYITLHICMVNVHENVKNVNLTYGGNALSSTNTKLS